MSFTSAEYPWLTKKYWADVRAAEIRSGNQYALFSQPIDTETRPKKYDIRELPERGG